MWRRELNLTKKVLTVFKDVILKGVCSSFYMPQNLRLPNHHVLPCVICPYKLWICPKSYFNLFPTYPTLKPLKLILDLILKIIYVIFLNSNNIAFHSVVVKQCHAYIVHCYTQYK